MATACDVLLEEFQPSRDLEKKGREGDKTVDASEHTRDEEIKGEGTGETKLVPAKTKKKKKYMLSV